MWQKHWHILLKKITTLCLIKKFTLHLKILKIMTFYIAFFNSYSLANIYQCDDGERNRKLAAEYKKIRHKINKDEMPLTYNLASMLENGYKSDSRHDNEDYIFRTYFET